MITVDALMAASFEPAVKGELNGRPWKSPKLNQWTDEGRIVVIDADPHHPLNKILSVSVLWSEVENCVGSGNDKISFTAALIENVMDAVDFLIEERLEQSGESFLVCQNHRYNHGPIRPMNDLFVMMVFTVGTFLPKEEVEKCCSLITQRQTGR